MTSYISSDPVKISKKGQRTLGRTSKSGAVEKNFVLALGRLRQEDQEFKDNLSYILRSRLAQAM